MAKAQKTKPRDLVRWRVSLITATPAKLIDFTMAPDAEAAEEQVAEAHEISAELRPRLIAVREDARQTFKNRGQCLTALGGRYRSHR
jgi:hypothetical protein